MNDMAFDSSTTVTDTVVGPTVKIQGDLNSDGNIRIDGQVSGTISTKQSVQVGDGAFIKADVSAGNASIAGHVQGNLNITGQLTLQGTAKISGDISCSVLRVEDGAQFNGKCSMGGNNKPNQVPTPQMNDGDNTDGAD